jgi:hypothetical protein
LVNDFDRLSENKHRLVNTFVRNLFDNTFAYLKDIILGKVLIFLELDLFINALVEQCNARSDPIADHQSCFDVSRRLIAKLQQDNLHDTRILRGLLIRRLIDQLLNQVV